MITYFCQTWSESDFNLNGCYQMKDLKVDIATREKSQ